MEIDTCIIDTDGIYTRYSLGITVKQIYTLHK